MLVPERRGTGLYFSVSAACVIGGVQRRVGVCYKLPGDCTATVEKLQAEGRARVYREEMRIVSGVAYPAAKKASPAVQAAQAAPAPSSVPARRGKK